MADTIPKGRGSRRYDQSIKNIPQGMINPELGREALENAADSTGLESTNAKILPPIVRQMSKTIGVASTAATITVRATSAAVGVLTANPKRSTLLIVNRSTTDFLYITFGQKPNANLLDAIPIPAGGNLFYDRHCPTNDVLAVTSGPTVDVTITEGVYI